MTGENPGSSERAHTATGTITSGRRRDAGRTESDAPTVARIVADRT
ncbi:hypothetical protein ACWD5R_01400 [Streptomyces sp. NPDC002514]